MTTPRSHRGSAVLTATALVFGTGSPCRSQVGQIEKVLSGVHETAHFTFRFRPNSRAAASVDRAAVMIERDLVDICAKLSFDVGKARFVIHLFDDGGELAQRTGVKGTGGFSAGDKMFLPFGNDQTRYHELVHLVAYRLPRSGRQPRNLFFAEGLANALLQFVHGVHVHAVAAVELRFGKMPSLAEMTGTKDFYGWLQKHPGFNAYDVAASYVRFLIDTEGIDKVKRYYTGAAPEKVFGKGLATLEKSWHAHLAKLELRPALVTLLRKRRGEHVAFAKSAVGADARLPADVLGEPAEWKPLVPAQAAIDRHADWQTVSGSIEGRSRTSDWTVFPLAEVKVRDGALRAKVAVPRGTVGVQLRFGERCQAMITNAGLFLWNGGVRHMNREERLRGPATIDLVVLRSGSKVTFYLDGAQVLSGEVGNEPGVPAIGVAGGTASFESVRLRRF
ncbi:MAG: hypothetical protein KDC87_09490 [Planctomycetes bacterium]|nr:hypothetical protein [Planctomycetota bacterium]MCB9870339.1 hypothetical protein [Planctomycetota bacterium]MCB9888084.1 hypothetical protein [Planctomycetota bacterium]